MRCTVRLGIVLFAMALSTGCKEDNPWGDPISFSDYCGEYADMMCRVAERCDCLGGYSVSLCKSAMAAECRDEYETPVNEGRMAYDGDEAGDCLAGLWQAGNDCSSEGDDWPASCDRILVGLVPVGQACDENDRCQPQGGEGAPCTDDEHCLSWDCDGDTCLKEDEDFCSF